MSEEHAPDDFAPDDPAPDAPRERQTLRLPESKLDSLREWAVEGTALTAAARVCDPDGRIALVRNRWSDGWILPGGAVEPGETPVEAARREVREETGLDATIGDPVVVFDQTYVAEADEGTSGRGERDREEGDREKRLTASYVVYAARAEGSIPDASRLGTSEGEIAAARWFETLPAALHDGDLLRPYL